MCEENTKYQILIEKINGLPKSCLLPPLKSVKNTVAFNNVSQIINCMVYNSLHRVFFFPKYKQLFHHGF